MKEIGLKYGCNPNQLPAKIYVNKGQLPIKVLNGKPGYINFLDALNAWQLVKELYEMANLPAAASFKHVSPSGAAIGHGLSETEKQMYFVPENLQLSPLANAYARARGADRMSSYGDWVALSHECDEETALLLQNEVSDGIIAPAFSDKALKILKAKRKGSYNIVQINKEYTPDEIETKEVFGITFSQKRNNFKIDESLLTNIVSENKSLTQSQKQDLLLSLITLKYTQSNSVCYVKNGQAIGIGAGQQSRIHCTRLAGTKADNWHLRTHNKVQSLNFVDEIQRANRDNAIDLYISEDANDVLANGVWQNIFKTKPPYLSREEKAEFLAKVKGVSLGSDAFFPFGDNIERAYKSGVSYIIEPGGSIRDDNVLEVCNKYNMVLAFCKMRLFHH